jgi:hypothetical protein
MSTYYITDGSVRGDCGHRHRTMRTAHKCLLRDRDGCQSQGGYSDRDIYRVTRDSEQQLPTRRLVFAEDDHEA